MEMETTTECFSESLLKTLKEAKMIENLGKYNEALLLHKKVEREGSKSCLQRWVLKNNKLCINLKKSFKEQKCFSVIDGYQTSFKNLLIQVQGVGLSHAGVIIELMIVCNILYLNLVKNVCYWSERHQLPSETSHLVKNTFLNVKCLVFGKAFLEEKDCQISSLVYEEILIQYLITVLKKLNINLKEDAYLLTQGVVTVSKLFALSVSLQNQGLSMLTELTTKVAKMMKKTTDIFGIFVLQSMELFDQLYQVSLMASLARDSNLDKEKAFDNIGVIKEYEERHHLHLVIKALILLRQKDYEASYFFCQKAYSQMKADCERQKSLKLNLIWNVLGICFIVQGKPNLALRAFNQSAKATRMNKAGMINMITTLEVLEQYDAKASCLQQFLVLAENDSKKEPEQRFESIDFEDIFLWKSCKEYCAKFESVDLENKKHSFKLYCEDIDTTWILSELAEVLYKKGSYEAAADAYLDLIRILREAKDDSDPATNSIHIFHRAVNALLKAERFHNCLTVCNYVLKFSARIPVCETSEKEVSKAAVESSFSTRLFLDEDVPVLLYKSDCLRRLGELEEAISTLKRAISILEADLPVDEPLHKRQKVDVETSCVNKNVCETWPLPDLKLQAYNNLGVTFIKSDNSKEALVAFKNAVKCKPDNPDSDVVYNFCKMLMQANLPDIALRNWNSGFSANETLESLQKVLSDNYKVILR